MPISQLDMLLPNASRRDVLVKDLAVDMREMKRLLFNRTQRCRRSVLTAVRKSVMTRCLSVLSKSITDGSQRFVADLLAIVCLL